MTGFIVSVFPFRNRVSSKEAFEGLELGEGKLSRPVLRGPGGRKTAWLLGQVPFEVNSRRVEQAWRGLLNRAGTFPFRRRQFQIHRFLQVRLGVSFGCHFALLNVGHWFGGRNPGFAIDIVDRGQHTLCAILGKQSEAFTSHADFRPDTFPEHLKTVTRVAGTGQHSENGRL
jgi:hypothetical protein